MYGKRIMKFSENNVVIKLKDMHVLNYTKLEMNYMKI